MNNIYEVDSNVNGKVDNFLNKIKAMLYYKFEETQAWIKSQSMRRKKIPMKVMMLENVFRGFLMIDTTVWLNEDADMFFHALLHCMKQHHNKVYLCTAQLNEIEKKKSITDYNTRINRQSRKALRRIEVLQSAGCLDIGSMKIDDSSKTYADPEILKVIKFMDSRDERTVLITSDRTLRIRVRQVNDNKCKVQHDVMEMNELSMFYKAYIDYYRVSENYMM